ncbi:hypothetical protein WME73_49815 [Sorangium sp. So ce302]|uniref:hypothetical protein n=1 Tax=Sorangium sp. So ce302 TaxID=3133297 RepID=UPI003F61F6E6
MMRHQDSTFASEDNLRPCHGDVQRGDGLCRDGRRTSVLIKSLPIYLTSILASHGALVARNSALSGSFGPFVALAAGRFAACRARSKDFGMRQVVVRIADPLVIEGQIEPSLSVYPPWPQIKAFEVRDSTIERERPEMREERSHARSPVQRMPEEAVLLGVDEEVDAPRVEL